VSAVLCYSLAVRERAGCQEGNRKEEGRKEKKKKRKEKKRKEKEKNMENLLNLKFSKK
jgi:hypothetical protein